MLSATMTVSIELRLVQSRPLIRASIRAYVALSTNSVAEVLIANVEQPNPMRVYSN